MAKNRANIKGFLNGLIFKRFKKQDLENKLSVLFGCPIVINWEHYKDCDWNYGDYVASFSTIGKDIDKDLQGDFELYYLETRKGNESKVDVFITEINYEFYTKC